MQVARRRQPRAPCISGQIAGVPISTLEHPDTGCSVFGDGAQSVVQGSRSHLLSFAVRVSR